MEYFIHHILPLKTLKTLGAIYKMYHMLVVPLWLNFYKSPPPRIKIYLLESTFAVYYHIKTKAK